MVRLGRFIDFFMFGASLGTIKTQTGFGPTGRYRIWDLLSSILIIGILSMIAIKIFTGYKTQAIALHCLDDETQLRVQCLVSYNLTGTWPDNVSGLEADNGFSYQAKRPDKYAYIESVQLDHGAFNFVFRNPLQGQTLTLRAAVPKEDPMGPVIWLTGNGLKRDDWTIFGEDNTTVEPWVINRFLE